MQSRPTPPARGASEQHLLIKSITPAGGEAIDVGTITALVGPNNAGKTEALRDIVRLAAKFEPTAVDRASGDEPRTTVISDLTFVPKLTIDRLTRGLTSFREGDQQEVVVQGIGPDLRTPYRSVVASDIKSILYRPIMTARSVWMTSLGELMPLRVMYLEPHQRNEVVEATAACGPLQAPENLLQALHYADASVHAELDDAFSTAFAGLHIQLDTTQRVNLSLRIASDFPPPSGSPIEAVQQFEQLRRLDEQGDGYKSLVAVVLSMLLGQGRIILLDQPEAALHPEQSRRLGSWIANNCIRLGCQVCVATRDPAFLAGLYHGEADVTIVRMSRKDNSTRLRPLAKEPGNVLARFPMFQAQHALDCLFHDGVVVVPDNDDRVIYQTVAERMLDVENVGFLHAHGGRNVTFVAKVLRQANIPACVITELDVFQDEAGFSQLVTAVTGAAPPQPWLATRERLAAHVEGQFDEQVLSKSAHEVETFLDQLKQGDASTETVGQPSLAPRDRSAPWRRLKEQRLVALPQELRIWVEELIEELKHQGIFVAPQGLQRWLAVAIPPENHAAWFTKAIQTIHQGQCPAELRAFVADVVSHVKTVSLPPRAARRSHGA